MKFRLTTLSAGIVGCLALAVPTMAAAQQCGGPAETKSLIVMADWLPWASQGPMITADLSGFYKQEGIAVKIISPANPADPIKLVARERVTFSLTYVPEIMISRERGIPVISVGASMRVLGSGLFYMADAPIKSPKDLKGKTLGVGPKLDAQAFLATLLAAGGLTKKDVKIVDPGYAHVPMVLKDKILAAHGLTFGEGVVADLILKKEGKKPVKWLLYRDYGVPNFYYQVFAANENWVKKNPNTTCRFLRATAKGTDVWMKSPDAALAVIAKANKAFNPEQHRGIYDASLTHWKAKDGSVFKQDLDVWQSAQSWALEKKLISKKVGADSYFTNDFLPK